MLKKFVVNSEQSDLIVTINSRSIGKYRSMVANGRQHLVVDVMAIEGDSVMNRRLYPSTSVVNNYQKLSQALAPVGHPKIDGKYVSARDPLALNAFGIGAFVRSPKLQGKEAIAEIWIDEAIANNSEHGRRVVDAIKSGAKVGVSTGLLVDESPAVGANEYDFIVNSFDVDHLAILLDETPAGKNTFIRNEENKLDKLLVINALAAIGVFDASRIEQLGAMDDQALIDEIKKSGHGITANELQLFQSKKDDFLKFVEAQAAVRAEKIGKIVGNSSFSKEELDLFDDALLDKLESSLIKPAPAQPANNALRAPAPIVTKTEFSLLEGS